MNARIMLITGLVCACLAGGLQGNTEQPVYSSDGQRPYLVVAPDAEGGSKRALGIYVADLQGVWYPILTGKLLAGRITNGILAQLELTSIDHRYESLALIDGKLTLFHLNTKEEDASSYLQLGSEKTPLVDILLNAEVNFPEIKSVDDISIATGPATADGQLVLVSVKTQRHEPLGQRPDLRFLCEGFRYQKSQAGNRGVCFRHRLPVSKFDPTFPT